MPESAQGSASTKVHRYPCPGCSADLVFEARDGLLTCPYCGRKEQIPSSAEQVQERSYTDYLKLHPERIQPLANDALEVQCGGCGVTVTFTAPQVAGDCPFCGASIVAEPTAAQAILAPESLIPFRIDHRQASESIKAWLSSRWFAPNALMRLAKEETATGVYLPFWTYDTYTVSHYTGERGEHYWVTETYVDVDRSGNRVTRTRRVRKTRWYPATGTVNQWFDDLLIPASKSLPESRLAALEPWGLADLKPYQPAYLAGYKAQRYQVDLKDGFELAKATIAPAILRNVCQDIGGDEQRVSQVRTAYSGITFKHLLLPVWVSAYRFSGSIYQVLVNARTGEVQGERPYSPWKILGLVAVLVLVVVILAYLSEIHS